MEQSLKLECDQEVTMGLIDMGLRERTKGFQYLSFALTVQKRGNPFSTKLWDAAAIYFGTTKKNIKQCVRREIAHAFQKYPDCFQNPKTGQPLAATPPLLDFMDMVQCRIIKK